MSDQSKVIRIYSDTKNEIPTVFLEELKAQYESRARNKLDDSVDIFVSESERESYPRLVAAEDRLNLLLDYRLSLTLTEYRQFGKLFGFEEKVNARIAELKKWHCTQKETWPSYPDIIWLFEFRPPTTG